MNEFALYMNGEFKEIRRYDEIPADIPHKKVVWYEVVREYGEPFVGLEGGKYVIRKVDPATLPAPVPATISDRQFFQQLASLKLITEEEAEDAVASGVMPASIATLVEMLPEDHRHPARMLIKGATVFERGHAMTETIAQLYGFTSEQVDDLFREASKL